MPDSTETPTLTNNGQSNIFRPYDLPDTPPSTNTQSTPNINTIAQNLRKLALHAHCKIGKQVTGCIVRGKLYDQVFEETVSDYLYHTVEPGETTKNRDIKRRAFLDRLQCRVVTFVTRGLS